MPRLTVVACVPVDFFKKLNEFSPALTLLVITAGFVWTAATRNAQFEVVTQDLAELTTNVEAVQTDVHSVQETLPHMVSCMIDLQRFSGAPGRTKRRETHGLPCRPVANTLSHERRPRKATDVWAVPNGIRTRSASAYFSVGYRSAGFWRPTVTPPTLFARSDHPRDHHYNQTLEQEVLG